MTQYPCSTKHLNFIVGAILLVQAALIAAGCGRPDERTAIDEVTTEELRCQSCPGPSEPDEGSVLDGPSLEQRVADVRARVNASGSLRALLLDAVERGDPEAAKALLANAGAPVQGLRVILREGKVCFCHRGWCVCVRFSLEGE